jgi:flagellar basal-body rod protein FlgB
MTGIDQALSLAMLALDAGVLRHQAIANNLANVNSTGYVPLKVNFEEQLAFLQDVSTGRATSRTALAGIRPFIEQDSAGNASLMIDMEMVKLAQNTVHYQTLLKAVGRKLAILSLAVNEGRR